MLDLYQFISWYTNILNYLPLRKVGDDNDNQNEYKFDITIIWFIDEYIFN